jgi:hypothetical protein
MPTGPHYEVILPGGDVIRVREHRSGEHSIARFGLKPHDEADKPTSRIQGEGERSRVSIYEVGMREEILVLNRYQSRWRLPHRVFWLGGVWIHKPTATTRTTFRKD